MKRPDTIRIRVSLEEKETLEENARRDGLPLSSWLRQVGLRGNTPRIEIVGEASYGNRGNNGGTVYRTSGEVYHFARTRIPKGFPQEVFAVMLVDAKHRLLPEGYRTISVGSLTGAIVQAREVFRPAIRESAAALFLIHNHPSGDPAPSAEDVDITRRLREVGEAVGIRVLDHVVVGADRHFSFVDAGYW